ncbi:hypothetical protein GT039_17750 [Streptomyces sp. SID2955]|nr:hypothetical protein [Streptomyces sp. SID2955]
MTSFRAFGTDCANLNARVYTGGATTTGTDAAGGNSLRLLLDSPLNQCGGADFGIRPDDIVEEAPDVPPKVS